jgi:hypothetical protein
MGDVFMAFLAPADEEWGNEPIQSQHGTDHFLITTKRPLLCAVKAFLSPAPV